MEKARVFTSGKLTELIIMPSFICGYFIVLERPWPQVAFFNSIAAYTLILIYS